jgi:hypothetical protein
MQKEELIELLKEFIENEGKCKHSTISFYASRDLENSGIEEGDYLEDNIIAHYIDIEHLCRYYGGISSGPCIPSYCPLLREIK